MGKWENWIYNGDVNEIGFDGDESLRGNRYLSSYTVAYEKQSREKTYINICGNHEVSKDDAEYMLENNNPQKEA